MFKSEKCLFKIFSNLKNVPIKKYTNLKLFILLKTYSNLKSEKCSNLKIVQNSKKKLHFKNSRKNLRISSLKKFRKTDWQNRKNRRKTKKIEE
jgi:hypothetical protein